MNGLRIENEIDELDWAILEALQADARLSFSELARRVRSSPPTVSERVRRLEDQGVITGYQLLVERKRMGWPIMAFVRLVVPSYSTSKVDVIIRDQAEISECHRVTGDDCFIIKVHARSVEHLEEVLKVLSRHGQTSTSIVLSSIVTGRVVDRPDIDASA